MGNLFTFSPNYSASFHGSATFRNDKTHFHYMFLLPNFRKAINTIKGLNILPLSKDSFQMLCFTTHQRTTIKGILDFHQYLFTLPAVSSNIF